MRARSEMNAERVMTVSADELLSLAADVTRAGAGIWVRVRGGSMMPTIERGSDVLVEPVPSTGVRHGDIVLVRDSSGRPLLHRIVRVANNRVWLKGDFRVTIDAPVDADAIVGIATQLRRDGKVTALSRSMPNAPLDIFRRWRGYTKDLLRRG